MYVCTLLCGSINVSRLRELFSALVDCMDLNNVIIPPHDIESSSQVGWRGGDMVNWATEIANYYYIIIDGNDD